MTTINLDQQLSSHGLAVYEESVENLIKSVEADFIKKKAIVDEFQIPSINTVNPTLNDLETVIMVLDRLEALLGFTKSIETMLFTMIGMEINLNRYEGDAAQKAVAIREQNAILLEQIGGLISATPTFDCFETIESTHLTTGYVIH